MRREKGKVPTDVNKDMVASGAVKNQSQIKSDGSKTPQNWKALIRNEAEKKESRVNQSKPIDREFFKKEAEKVKVETRQQPAKEYVKRIEKGNDKDK